MAYANVTYTGDGANKEFQIPFEYLSQTHLTVTRDAVADTNGVEYTINTSTQKVVYVTAPAGSVAVKIQRVTPIATEDRPVDFEGGSGLGEDDLDSVALTSVFLAQEAKDDEDDALALKADVTYVDAQVAANSVTDQAYADALAIAAGAGDVFIGGGTTTTDEFLQWNATGTKVVKGGIGPDTDTTLAADSDTKIATQKATKAYVDTQVAAIPVTSLVAKNYLNNSGLTVDIENHAGGTPTNLDHVVENWQMQHNGTGTMTCSRDTTIVPDSSRYSLKLDVTGTDTPSASEFYSFNHKIEGWDVSDLLLGTANAKTVTLSFKVYSSVADTFCVAFKNNAQDRAYIAEYTIPNADQWEDISITLTLDDSGTWETTSSKGLDIRFVVGAGATVETTAGSWQAGDYFSTSNQYNLMADTANYFYIAEPKLEIGTSATTWELPNYEETFSHMQRYFQYVNFALVMGDNPGTDYLTNNNPSWIYNNMRVAPTATKIGGSGSGVTFLTNFDSMYQNTIHSVTTPVQVSLNSRF